MSRVLMNGEIVPVIWNFLRIVENVGLNGCLPSFSSSNEPKLVIKNKLI
jgi:hypothetical protein